MLMAITASVMQCVGLLLPFWELAKRNGRVIGIGELVLSLSNDRGRKAEWTRFADENGVDFWFLTIDYAGAFFSLMALVAQHTFDVLGSSMYIVW